MPRVIYSQRANIDLVRLHRFLAEKNPVAAIRALKAIRAKIGLLRRFPELSPVDPEQPNNREMFIKFGRAGYVARYHYDGLAVIVLAIRHMREAGYSVED